MKIPNTDYEIKLNTIAFIGDTYKYFVITRKDTKEYFPLSIKKEVNQQEYSYTKYACRLNFPNKKNNNTCIWVYVDTLNLELLIQLLNLNIHMIKE